VRHDGDPASRRPRDYFAVRRALGFKLTRDGLLLGQFVSFLEEAGASTVTTELALSWTTSPAKQSPSWLAMRLSIGGCRRAGARPPTSTPRRRSRR